MFWLTFRFLKCFRQEKVRIGDCGCHSFYYGRGSQPFLHSLGHKPNAALLAGRWDRGVLRDRGSQLPVRRLLGGFGSSGRWQVSLMGADMKSLDEGVTTLTVRLLPKASWISWDLGNTMPFGYLWLSLGEMFVFQTSSGPSKPLSACVSHAKEDARSNRGFWEMSNWLLILVDSRLHEGFPFISSILQAAVWHRKDRMRKMHFERCLKYLEIFILHDVYPVNCWVCRSFSQEMFGIIDWAAESREAMPQATAAWSLKRPCVPRCGASRAFAQVEVTPLETNGKQLDVAHTVEDECTDCCSCYLHQSFSSRSHKSTAPKRFLIQVSRIPLRRRDWPRDASLWKWPAMASKTRSWLAIHIENHSE